jgi:hypothetical protein
VRQDFGVGQNCGRSVHELLLIVAFRNGRRRGARLRTFIVTLILIIDPPLSVGVKKENSSSPKKDGIIIDVSVRSNNGILIGVRSGIKLFSARSPIKTPSNRALPNRPSW